MVVQTTVSGQAILAAFTGMTAREIVFEEQ